MEAVSPEPRWERGGLLHPGQVQCVNRTGQPERILTPEELRRLTEEDES